MEIGNLQVHRDDQSRYHNLKPPSSSGSGWNEIHCLRRAVDGMRFTAPCWNSDWKPLLKIRLKNQTKIRNSDENEQSTSKKFYIYSDVPHTRPAAAGHLRPRRMRWRWKWEKWKWNDDEGEMTTTYITRTQEGERKKEKGRRKHQHQHT